jgi:polysaccharide biosynthesis protein PslG
MKLRSLLAIVSLFLSLVISADNRSNECTGCWMPTANLPTVEESLGVNVHFIEPRPGEVKMIADAGFRWVRTDFIWEVTEPDRGRYDFSAYDRLLKQLDEFQIHALFILDYGNRLYTHGKSVRTPEARAAFARWAVAAGRHFAGRGVIWELFNEPNNTMFWPPQPNAEEYNALAQEVGRAFRDALPNERLIGPAVDSNDLKFLQSCLNGRSHEWWSALSVHPYRETNPETVANNYARLREMLDKAGSGGRQLQIISSEWGYSSAWSSMSEERQAIMLTRQFLTNLANGIPLSIWYDWQDDGVDPNEDEHHFGLVRYTDKSGTSFAPEPKPAFLAAKTLTTMLNGFRFQQRLNAGGPFDYVLTFVKGNERRIVVWTAAPAPHRLAIPYLSGRFSLTTMSGGTGGRAVAADDMLTIEVSQSPVYLISVN